MLQRQENEVASELTTATMEVSTMLKGSEALRALGFHHIYYRSADLAEVTCCFYNLELKENKET